MAFFLSSFVIFLFPFNFSTRRGSYALEFVKFSLNGGWPLIGFLELFLGKFGQIWVVLSLEWPVLRSSIF